MDQPLDPLLKELQLRSDWLASFDEKMQHITDIPTRCTMYQHKNNELANTVFDLCELCNRTVAKANEAAAKQKGISENLKAMLDGAEAANLTFLDRLSSNMIHDPVVGMKMMLHQAGRAHAIAGDGKQYPSLTVGLRFKLAWRLMVGQTKA